jgi:hypothetical protein
MLQRFTACLTAFAVYSLTVFGPAMDARASQNALSSPTTGTVSGLQLTNNYNSALDSLNTCNSGASAPTNQLSAAPSLGNCWINTSTTPNTLNYYDGAQWLAVAYIDTVNHILIPILGGGNGMPSIASASTTNLCPSSVGATVAPAVTVTGTTTISSFGTNCQNGGIKVVEFSGALTLTNSGSLVLLGGSNITTAAGDFAVFIYVSGTGWYNVAYSKANGSALSTVGLSIGASALANSALGFGFAVNAQLHTAVGSNQLTISLCTTNSGSNTCNNASSSNPVLLPFRDGTGSNGDPVIVSLQASLSFTIGSGDTMGCVNGQMCRLWVFALDNSGTVQLCAWNALNSSTPSVADISEGISQTSASGTGGGNNAQTLYCNGSAVTGTLVRLGYVEISESTAGTWASNATFVQSFGPGIARPGEVLQHIAVQSTAASDMNSGTLGLFNITPALTQTISPHSAADPVFVHSSGTVTNSGGSGPAMSLSFARKIGAGSYAAVGLQVNVVNGGLVSMPELLDLPGSTSTLTYTFFGSCTSGDLHYPTGGGTSGIVLDLQEIQGALDHPANDNGVVSAVG